MRKIDAVIMSALILYDYSAQSLVDSNIINIGNSFIIERSNLGEDGLSDPLFVPNQVFSNNEETNVDKGDQEIPSLAVKSNVSYYDLAKINPASSSINRPLESAITNTIQISTPNRLSAVTVVLAESAAPEVTTEVLTMSMESVTSSLTLLSNVVDLEVKDQNGDMQFVDSDDDGMFNFEDKCPGIAGVARFDGCPVPDSDADGVSDEEDRCPNEKGSDENNGCPVVETSIVNVLNINQDIRGQKNEANYTSIIEFERNNDLLTNKNFNIILQIADKIINNFNAQIQIIRSVDDNSSLQSNIIASYLKDLGIKTAQISFKTTNSLASAGNNEAAVQLKY